MTKRRPRAGFFDKVLRTSMLVVPTLFIYAVVQAQMMGEGGDFGIAMFGGGTVGGATTFSSTVQTTNLGVGTAPDTTRLHMFSEAADTAPTTFTADDLVVGRTALTGASSGAVFMRYDSTNSKAFLGALSPSVAWRPLVIGASQSTFQNASAVAKAIAPGSGVSNLTLASDGKFCLTTTTDAAGTTDACISRSGTNALKIENGSGTAAALTTAGLTVADITSSGAFTSSLTTTLGWSVVSVGNQACTTTCTSACVFGWDTGTTTIVDCASALSDKCVCAGGS